MAAKKKGAKKKTPAENSHEAKTPEAAVAKDTSTAVDPPVEPNADETASPAGQEITHTVSRPQPGYKAPPVGTQKGAEPEELWDVVDKLNPLRSEPGQSIYIPAQVSRRTGEVRLPPMIQEELDRRAAEEATD